MSSFTSSSDGSIRSDFPRTTAWNLCVGVCAVCAAISGNELCRTWQDSQPDDPFARAQRAMGPEIETVLIGSSHIWTGLMPTEFTNPSVNLSHPSNDYSMMSTTMDVALTECPNVKNVVMEFGIVPLFGDSIGRVGYAANFPRLGVRPLNYPRDIDVKLKHFIMCQPSLTLPKPTPASVFQRFFGQQQLGSQTIPGFRGQPVEPYRDNARLRGKSHSKRLHSDDSLERNEAALFQMLDDFESQGIRVVLIEPPRTSEYWNHVSDEAKSLLATTRERIEAEHDIDFLDLQNPEVTGLDEADFYDSDHVNSNGARRLSRIVDQFLLDPNPQSASSRGFTNLRTAD